MGAQGENHIAMVSIRSMKSMIYNPTVDLFDQFSRSGKAATARPVLVSFPNPLASGSGLVERTPKKVGF